MRASQLFLPTLREDPADAEAASHKLLVRGGFIRQVGAGLWTYMPLGWRVHQKVVQVIREEINAIGGQEMLCPVLTPAELWERTGRIAIPAVFKLTDGTGRPFVLPLSHEETMTFHAREIQSYRDLPQVWYHFSTKERDEARPRGGLLRVREFIMKDSYSFDCDEAGLDASFERHRNAYERIFERCGLRVYFVEAESGIMGGKESSGFLAPAGSGENELMRCENGDYFADIEAARGLARPAQRPDPLPAPEEVETPGVATIEALAEFLGIDSTATSKAMPVVIGDRLVLALVRGDDRLSEEKLMTIFESAFRPATNDEIRETFGADGGSIGPLNVAVEVVADEALREGQFVVGANRDGWHVRGVEAGRDFDATFADIREAKAGDACPVCGGSLLIEPAIEVGHIFKLGTFHSAALDATFVDEDGRTADHHGQLRHRSRPRHGGYRRAAPRRAWDRLAQVLAPYDVHIVAMPGVEQQAEALEERLEAAGVAVLLDDRELRAGEKFADADLIGCPYRITVGKKTLEDGAVDVLVRQTGEEERVRLEEVAV